MRQKKQVERPGGCRTQYERARPEEAAVLG